MNNRRIYLAGRVTGLNRKRVEKTFCEAQEYFQHMGFEVINPMRIVPEGSSWGDAMRMCIHYLSFCSYIAMLPGWEKSKGARIEYQLAVGMYEHDNLKAIIHVKEAEDGKE